ncbi:MAG TPA: hypothetical protein VEB86_18580 [Chryseosolibacter sp.]|nr:hypothetical protein [Chryseosolibacter sp.]
MKSTYFSRSSGEIRIIKSPETRKRFNWDKTIYLFIFTSIIAYLVYYLAERALVIKETGQVQFESLEIQYFKDIQIQKLFVGESDSVMRGDTLFSYHIERGDQFSLSDNRVEKQQDLDEAVARHQGQIRLKEAELFSLKSLLEFTQQEKSRIAKEIYLSVYTSNRLDPYVRKEEELKSSIYLLEREIEVMRSITPVIRQASALSGFSGENTLHYFTSPIPGTVAHIYMTEHETVLESEHIMSLFLPHKNVHIKTFFSSDDMKYLKIGDEVDVVFPDGTKSPGVVKQFFYDTYELPVQFHKYSEDVYKRIEADIEPLNPQDQEKWNASIKLEVVVRKNKYW